MQIGFGTKETTQLTGTTGPALRAAARRPVGWIGGPVWSTFTPRPAAGATSGFFRLVQLHLGCGHFPAEKGGFVGPAVALAVGRERCRTVVRMLEASGRWRLPPRPASRTPGWQRQRRDVFADAGEVVLARGRWARPVAWRRARRRRRRPTTRRRSRAAVPWRRHAA